MPRAYNFSPGPAMLPESVLRQAQATMLEYGDAGASILEISHRGADFLAVAHQAEADLRTLLAIPDDYAVLFTAGGATTMPSSTTGFVTGLVPVGRRKAKKSWRRPVLSFE